MVFGKTRIDDATPNESEEFIDLIDDDSNDASQQRKEEKDNKPLLQEVTFVGTANSKNAGGAKVWICKHCKQRFTSSYTRIHVHLLGPPVEKKADIKRCHALLQDRQKYQNVFNKKPSCSKKPIEESFGVMERSMVDLKIMRGLCANGIPFNVLRNPHFQEMVSAINKAPDGYKPPSSEKARTVLLDECVRDVEKDLTPIKDTWYSQGVSIVSDGWSNVKHNPLINVLAVNSRGAMFMYAEDFSGIEKTGVEIADFFISAIETVGPTNVLSVVTDNASNCKAAGVEIEKGVFSNDYCPQFMEGLGKTGQRAH
ncbi:putative ribonuclease H-like domain-containing protein [Tanacetum coccineum]